MSVTLWVQILLFVLTAYFIVASVVPRIRLQWGIRAGVIITFSRRGFEPSKFKEVKPRMGTLTCLGWGSFFAAIANATTGKMGFIPVYYPIVISLVLLGVGAILDWFREPPKFTKR